MNLWCVRSAVVVAAVMAAALNGSAQGAQPTQLAGCDAPSEVAQRMRAMALTTTDWRTVVPSEIRSKWSGLLNQVDCPTGRDGTYLLASFDRIIRDEPHCGTTFAVRVDRARGEERLAQATVYHSTEQFARALETAEVFESVWRAGSGRVETDDEEWMRLVKRGEAAKGTLRWRATITTCDVEFQIEKAIYKTASGWTTKVSLSGESECRK
jgi:hypothetical protein